jgi:hypothetical protein
MWACHCDIGTALEAADLGWDGLGIIAPGFAWLTATSELDIGKQESRDPATHFDLERRLLDVYGPTGFAL